MNLFRRASVRYGRTPEPETPYQKAAQVWDERIGCRAGSGEELAADGLRIADPVGGLVASRWSGNRCAARSCRGSCRSISSAKPKPWRPRSRTIVRPIRRSPGTSRASSSRFARIPADPVIVRQNWLRAYEFTTDRGAAALNDYARANDPFAKVGKRQVADRGLQRHPRLARQLPCRLDRALLRERPARCDRALDRDPHHRGAAATRRRSPERESARHLRQRHQLVEGARTMKPPFHKAGAPASRHRDIFVGPDVRNSRLADRLRRAQRLRAQGPSPGHLL